MRPPCSQNENNLTGTFEPLRSFPIRPMRKSPIRPMLAEYLSNEDDVWPFSFQIDERLLTGPLLGKPIPSVRKIVENDFIDDQNPSNVFFGAGRRFDVSSFAAMDLGGDPIRGDEDLRSTGSSSANASHKYGVTYSSGEISGISDSIFMP